jgi:O-methyltransferase
MLGMFRLAKSLAHAAVRKTGFDIVRSDPASADSGPKFPPDFSQEHISIIRSVSSYTMTSPERIYALIEAVRYVVHSAIPGAIVECGVWRGGSMMAAALALKSLNAVERDLYLFDTFEGMPKPQEVDVDLKSNPAMSFFSRTQIGEDSSGYCRSTLEEARVNMASIGYSSEKIHFCKGKVESTIPGSAPEQIAVLRLDTDWYESTKHELIHLYPLLSPGGILIIDDYGHWRGSRKATDEYIKEYAPSLFLGRIDYTGRIAVKPTILEP